ncbi:DUF3387 domain-containing protein [Massilia glaciei]|uniref:DUF3387 domain-containing protein n=1 Tax=Massilia glaciei TaxID=1524097 RepID=UPI00351D3BF4
MDTGYSHFYGPDIALDGDAPERANYTQVVLVESLRNAISRLNPVIPMVARDDALQQVLNLDTPLLLSANRLFQRLLVNGVPVEYQCDGETRGDFVRLIDFADVASNEWLAINQFSIKGPKHTRRPDIILFIKGLPLVLLELKNPADEHVDIWKAYDQIETYKEQIPDVFQIIGAALVSNTVVDIISASGLDKSNIGILDEDFLNEVRNLPERNLAVELPERLLENEIRARFATNVVQNNKFSEMLTNVIKRYQNRSIETAQVMEELIAMAKKFKEEAARGANAGLNTDELAFYDALADNEESVRELGDETLKRIAHELAESLRQNASVDWAVRESVRAKLRLMVKRILRKYKYPPTKQDAAVALVLEQAESLSAQWA